jgi:hypothetical protein
MDIEETFRGIQGLEDLVYQISKREPAALEELNRLYRIVYGETVTAGCSGCHLKAYKKLTSLTINDLQEMEDQDFKIKQGVLVEYPFRSGQFFSSALGVTNELAVEYLTEHPAMIDQFEVYPGSESESKELDLSLLGSPVGTDLSKLNKTGLQAEYAKAFGNAPDEALTKAELIKAIEEKA